MRTKIRLPVDLPGLYSLNLNSPSVVSEVELPEGWRRVWRGVVKPGDQYLNLILWYDGIISWVDVGVVQGWRAIAKAYALLIRCEPGDGPDLPCEHCELEPRETGYRYCRGCMYDGIHRPKQE